LKNRPVRITLVGFIVNNPAKDHGQGIFIFSGVVGLAAIQWDFKGNDS